MKLLGLIGGMSWESTAVYYRLLNEGARKRAGGLHSANLVLWSFDFHDIETLQEKGDWAAADAMMADAAMRLTEAGAERIVICTNTMHKCAPAIERAGAAPILHIADATAAALAAANVRRPALLATRYTMEEDFLKARIAKKARADILIPGEADRALVHRVIYEELCRGVIKPASKAAFIDLVNRLAASGADGVILGCTEVGLLIESGDVAIPVFDTTRIHVEAALDFSLGR